jgi:mono/diheme cytochrome c family protein
VQHFLALSAAVLVLAACAPEPAMPQAAVFPTESPERLARIAADRDLQAGQTAYNLRCAHCHGYAGEGQLASTVANTQALGLHTVPAHDATGHTWQHPDQLIRQIILQGAQNPLNHYPMPPFEGVLSDDEIAQITAYMRLWWTDEQRAWQAQLTERRSAIEAEYGVGG